MHATKTFSLGLRRKRKSNTRIPRRILRLLAYAYHCGPDHTIIPIMPVMIQVVEFWYDSACMYAEYTIPIDLLTTTYQDVPHLPRIPLSYIRHACRHRTYIRALVLARIGK